jgi:hypothetical protein
LDPLAAITEELWDKTSTEIIGEMNLEEHFECSFDEQHSRPQRFVYGAAPYATCTLMNQNQMVFHMSHVDKEEMKITTATTKAGKQCKAKAKVAHMNAFNFMKSNLTAKLLHLCADQSADGSSDAERILRNHWCAQIYFILFIFCFFCGRNVARDGLKPDETQREPLYYYYYFN